MKKIICLLLALVMALCVFASCGEEREEEATTKAVTDEEEVTYEHFGKLTKKGKIDPADYYMAVRQSRYDYLFEANEAPSDFVQQQVYKRNANIEEDYWIEFKIVQFTDSAEAFTQRMQASAESYNLVVPDYYWGIEKDGYFLNLNNYDEIDFDDDYWYSGWNDNTKIKGKSYTIVGDASLELLQNIEVVFFNRKTIKDLHEDDGDVLYSKVNAGEWTISAMMEICDNGAKLDGDDASEYVYGALYDKHSMRAQLFSCGLKLTDVSDTGDVTIVAGSSPYNQINDKIVEKVTELRGKNYVNYSDVGGRARDYSLFKNGQAIFYASSLYMGTKLFYEEMDFGIVIMPKMDATDDYQTEYSATNYGTSVFAIPKANANTHMNLVILDELNARSQDTVVDMYYDTILISRTAIHINDSDQIDLARSLQTVDFAFVNTIHLTGAFYDAVVNQTALATELAATLTTAQTSLEELMAFYNTPDQQ